MYDRSNGWPNFYCSENGFRAKQERTLILSGWDIKSTFSLTPVVRDGTGQPFLTQR